MGSPISATIANLVIVYDEETAVSTASHVPSSLVFKIRQERIKEDSESPIHGPLPMKII